MPPPKMGNSQLACVCVVNNSFHFTIGKVYKKATWVKTSRLAATNQLHLSFTLEVRPDERRWWMKDSKSKVVCWDVFHQGPPKDQRSHQLLELPGSPINTAGGALAPHWRARARYFNSSISIARLNGFGPRLLCCIAVKPQARLPSHEREVPPSPFQFLVFRFSKIVGRLHRSRSSPEVDETRLSVAGNGHMCA